MQVQLRSQQTTDETKAQRLLNNAIMASTLMESPAWPWHAAELERRHEALVKQLVHARNDVDETNVLRGRIAELEYVMKLVSGRVSDYQSFKAKMRANAHHDNEQE